MRSCSWERLWAVCDGDRERMPLAHACLDRHWGEGLAISVTCANSYREHDESATLGAGGSIYVNAPATALQEEGDGVDVDDPPSVLRCLPLATSYRRLHPKSLFLGTQVRESAMRNVPWSWVLIASCAQ
jgi:hypothetical protein